MIEVRIPAVQAKYWAFNGGLDLVTPPFSIPAGCLRSCANVEIGINGGYTRIAGYERYSGKARPSAAVYAVLTCSVTAVSVGDVLTDNAGTSFGTVIALPTGQAILTLITGTFTTGNVKVGGVVKGTCTGGQEINAASTMLLSATYRNLAADVYRALIAAVPGSGSILGVHQYNSKVYAFRNNAGATAAVLHESSASGWAAVTMYNEVRFTAATGTATIVDGGTLTQGAVTATIKRVVVTSGSLAAGTAAGSLIVTNPTGGTTHFVAGAATVGAGTLTLSGAESAITFLPGGRFEFESWNFGGATGANKMYGADGVNRAFEFDGTTLTPISTGMTTDTPKFVKAHKNQLFLSFDGSAQHSGIGNPYAWTIVSGAGELGCGDTITGFVTLPGNQTGGALCLKTKNRTLVLYGNDPTDWVLTPYSEEVGASPYTLQFITQAVCLDKQGIINLAATQNYGNFATAVMSDKITPALNDLIPAAISSCIVRKKNQYRLFFSGGAAFYVTFNGAKIHGITKIDMPTAVSCITSLEGAGGTEQIYFGSTDGFVYQMDCGTSFDGANIDWSAELVFNHLGSPRQLKSYRKAVTETTGTDYAEYSLFYNVGYGSSEYQSSATVSDTLSLSSSRWDSSITWDQFQWDGASLTPSECSLSGTAENVSLFYSGSSDMFEQFTLNGVLLNFVPRRQLR
jgi:hypothetical protein